MYLLALYIVNRSREIFYQTVLALCCCRCDQNRVGNCRMQSYYKSRTGSWWCYRLLDSMFCIFRFSLLIKGRFLNTKHVHELVFVSIFGYFKELNCTRVELFIVRNSLDRWNIMDDKWLFRKENRERARYMKGWKSLLCLFIFLFFLKRSVNFLFDCTGV